MGARVLFRVGSQCSNAVPPGPWAVPSPTRGLEKKQPRAAGRPAVCRGSRGEMSRHATRGRARRQGRGQGLLRPRSLRISGANSATTLAMLPNAAASPPIARHPSTHRPSLASTSMRSCRRQAPVYMAMRPHARARTAVRHEVSRERVTDARPRGVAPAAFVPRLVAEQRVAGARQRVLNGKLSVPRDEALTEPGDVLIPFRRHVGDLIAGREESRLPVDAGREKCLPHPERGALAIRQWFERHVLRHVRAVEPVHIDRTCGGAGCAGPDGLLRLS